VATPRLGDRPDLSGNWTWTDWIGNYMGGGGRRCAPTQPADCSRAVNQSYDFELYSPSRFGNTGRPIYKPEHWDKVVELDMWTNKYDPVMTCQPLGVPRQGPPRRIYQSDKDVTFIYLGGDAGGGYGEYRIIPTDGRQHDPNRSRRRTSATVSAVGSDTLVVDSSCSTISPPGRGGFHPTRCASSSASRVTATCCYTTSAKIRVLVGGDPDADAVAQHRPDAGLIRERGNTRFTSWAGNQIVTSPSWGLELSGARVSRPSLR
jgi:hypothetical protein